MAEMTENKEVIELAKEKNNLSVKSQVAQFQLKKKEFTQKSIETIVENYDQSGNRQRRTRKEEAVQKSAGGRFCHEEKNSLR